jgi:hypothetical protein
MACSRIAHYHPTVARGFRTGVSLHSHTHHSKEVLEFLPGWASRMPVLRSIARHELDRQRRLRGRPLDFSRAYWCPPLSPRAVIESEAAQIATKLSAMALVSITDHDNIDASLGLAAIGNDDATPVSVEWTIPYGGEVIHLGVHNLPPESAASTVATFRAFTAQPDDRQLPDLLEAVSTVASTLVVLNHPLWNAHVDRHQHYPTLDSFIRRHRSFLHAAELNGYRSHAENTSVIQLAQSWSLPIVAGGDRHGRAPNAMLNLTSASTFDQFVEEVRRDGRSVSVVMPECREHRATRVLEVIADVLRDDAGLDPGQRRWPQRVFIVRDDGRHQPLEDFWRHEAPLWARGVVTVASALGSVTARHALRLGLAVTDGGAL